MKVTKYQHACFTVENEGQVLVVDPGNYSSDFIAPENVTCVVITHQHPDHFDPELLAGIFDKNDDVLVIGPADVIDKIEIENKKTVSPGEQISVGSFDLEFFGGVHALIHSSMPRVQNIGVLVNGLVYYPGDSLDVPNCSIDTLAIPVAAPWLKIGEAMDFLLAVKPRFAFPTHDAITNDSGKALADRLIGSLAEQHDIEYTRLDSPIDV